MTDLPTGPPADEHSDSASGGPAPDGAGDGPTAPRNPRRRGSRGGRNRTRPRPEGAASGLTADAAVRAPTPSDPRDPELPDLPWEGEPVSVEAADASLVRRPAAT